MRLSVIIPVYNVEKYVGQCIESILRNDINDMEVIVVNDGSTDGSLNVVDEYAQKDSRVKVINKENGGCASARNAGINAATGEYIGFVDGDDFVDENMFSKLLMTAYDGGIIPLYDYIYCGYKEYYEDNKASQNVLNDKLSSPYLLGTKNRKDILRLVTNTRVAIWRAIYRADVIKKDNIFFHDDLKRFDDLPFRVEFIFNAKSVKCVDEYMYYYRLGRKGQDVSARDDRLMIHKDIFQHLDSYVENMRGTDITYVKKMKELLQVVKICTHGYALSIIEDEYRKEYIDMARSDLNKNFSYLHTMYLIMRYTGKSHAGWYTKMMFGK